MVYEDKKQLGEREEERGRGGEDTHCVMDDRVSSSPQLINCEKISNVEQKTWNFAQVKNDSESRLGTNAIKVYLKIVRSDDAKGI